MSPHNAIVMNPHNKNYTAQLCRYRKVGVPREMPPRTHTKAVISNNMRLFTQLFDRQIYTHYAAQLQLQLRLQLWRRLHSAQQEARGGRDCVGNSVVDSVARLTPSLSSHSTSSTAARLGLGGGHNVGLGGLDGVAVGGLGGGGLDDGLELGGLGGERGGG